MDNLRMIKTDDEQYCGHLNDGRFYLAEVRSLGEEYGIVTGIIDISDYQDEYEELVSSYYGSVENFVLCCPDQIDRRQLFAEMCFECLPSCELSCKKTYQKYREALSELADMFHTRRLFIDMDGTLTCFIPSTMEQLNAKGYFRNRTPQSNVVDAIRMVMRDAANVECFILSGVLDNPYAREDKTEWLRENLPEFDEKHTIFVPYGQDKSILVPGGVGKYDFLLDDFSLNLREWPSNAIKLKNNLNGTKGTWKGRPMVRYDDKPKDIKHQLMQYLFGKKSQVCLREDISTGVSEAVLTLNLTRQNVVARLCEEKGGLPFIRLSLQDEMNREKEFFRITAYPEVDVVECRIKQETCSQEEVYLISPTDDGFD